MINLKQYFSLRRVIWLLAICTALFTGTQAMAQSGLPVFNISDGTDGNSEYSLTLQVLLLMSVLTLIPSLLIMMTSFVRVIIVLSLLRQAIGTAQTPPNQVLVGIALFLTIFIMSPVFLQVYDESVIPYINEEVTANQAFDSAVAPLRSFMIMQTREEDMSAFMDIADVDMSTEYEDVPLSVLIPAFMTSELKTAFTIGFMIYIPFVIIDLVVASVLMSMGMMMLSPMMISMPFKLMLFVLADGWLLVMQSLTASFMGT
jgi:flagellar biosynthesis protein FliP